MLITSLRTIAKILPTQERARSKFKDDRLITVGEQQRTTDSNSKQQTADRSNSKQQDKSTIEILNVLSVALLLPVLIKEYRWFWGSL